MPKFYYRLESKNGQDALYRLDKLTEAMHSGNMHDNDFHIEDITACKQLLKTIKQELVKGEIT